MKKNAFLTFCCACVPGCGQMYQGYMKRGVSLLFWFLAIILVSSVTYIYPLLFLLPLVWAYAFFDAFNLRNLSIEQRAVFSDNFIPGASWLSGLGFEKIRLGVRLSNVAGWGVLIIGVLILLGNFKDMLLSYLYGINPELAGILNYGTRMAVGLAIGVAVILAGLRILRGRRSAALPDAGDIPVIEEGGNGSK